MGAKVGDVFQAGQKVVQSGIYLVTHERSHAESHTVTVISGKAFPTCSGCARPRFTLKHKARDIGRSEFFAGAPKVKPARAAASAPA